ncbi:MAG: helix-turn-helix domain-containing protein [Clostridia bacterium]|nr:helix-turn-helix domain-containing protein [Clostridia bacterium]
MKRLEIGNTILRLRKKNNITQERLANMIGVSTGAVSKWETGKSTPDITLLSPLARALNTSTDILLSFKEQLSEKDVNEIKKDLRKIFLQLGYSEGQKKCNDYLKEYPTCVYLKFVIAGLIKVYGIMTEDINSNDIIESRKYALSLYQDVVDSYNSKYTHISLFLMASINIELKNYAKGEQILKQLAETYVDPMSLYSTVLISQNKIKEAEKSSQNMLLYYLNQSMTMLMTLANISKENKDYDKCEFYLKSVKLLEKTFELGMHSSAYAYCKLHIEKQDYALAGKWFKVYVEGLLTTKYNYHENKFFNSTELEVNEDGQKLVRKKVIKELINDTDFKILAEMPEYTEAIKKLKKALN